MESVRCPRCWKEMPDAARFCGRCGVRLPDGPAMPPPLRQTLSTPRTFGSDRANSSSGKGWRVVLVCIIVWLIVWAVMSNSRGRRVNPRIYHVPPTPNVEIPMHDYQHPSNRPDPCSPAAPYRR